MSDESPDRLSTEPRTAARESWLDRLKLALGLRGPHSVRADLADALAADPEEAPDFSAPERRILSNVLGLREVRVSDVMVPRSDVFALSAESTLAQVVAAFLGAGHSRLPVYGETLDDPQGMVHIRDLFGALFTTSGPDGAPAIDPQALGRPLSSLAITRPVLFAPSGLPALDLLVRMQEQRIHMALVIDEYGGTDGLVSLEDLVETIVGEIEDEHDDEAPLIIDREEGGRLLVDGRVAVSEIAAEVSQDLATEASERDVDSIGGLVTAIAGRVPAAGETIDGPDGVRFTILDADRRRIRRLAIDRESAGVPAPGLEAGPDLSP